MVVGPGEIGLLADVVFVIEGTAINGAYLNDMKTNYVVPTLEFFSQGSLEDKDYVSESNSTLYAVVTYQAADCLPCRSSDCYGPYSNPQKLLTLMDRLELVGGKGESHANIAEGLATALECFEDLQQKREPNVLPQKHCILVCNSPPYQLPAMESPNFSGHTVEELAGLLLERGIHLSILSPRKIPVLFKLYEKAGGDLQTSQTKNYAKDLRHLVLLKGYSLKERPISPIPNPPPHQPLPGATNPAAPAPGVTMPNQPSPVAPAMDIPVTTPTSIYRHPQGSPIPHPPANTVPRPQGNQMGANPPMQPVNQPPVFRVNVPNQAVAPRATNQMQTAMQPQGDGLMPRGPGPRWQFQPSNQGMPQAGMMQGSMPPQPLYPGGFQQIRSFNPSGASPSTTPTNSALIDQLIRPTIPMNSQFPSMENTIANSVMVAVSQPGQLNPSANQQQQPGRPQGNQIGSMQQSMQPNAMANQGQPSATASNQNQVTAAGQASNPNSAAVRERRTIWQGVLEWIEKSKNPSDQQKLTRRVPCQVLDNPKDGDPELKADSWPPTLIMQLMPKHLIGTIGGAYLRNSKSVLFHPQNCEALETLTKLMSSGFAGIISMPSSSASDIKILILLYTAEKKAYLGFIPNDQPAFVDRLKKVIQQQKSQHQLLRQGGGPNSQGMSNMPSGQGMNLPNSTVAVTTQGVMMSQTNTMAMVGSQMTQNVSSGNSMNAGGQLQQAVSMAPGTTGTNQTTTGQIGLQQNPDNHLGNQGPQASNTGGQMRPHGMMAPVGARQQQQPFNQIHVDRQKNLMKIQQLKQTLADAQQQEIQYKSQLEFTQIISHLEAAQQQEMQFKAQMEEQQKQQQLRAQLQQQIQQQQIQQQQQQQQRQMSAQNLPVQNQGMQQQQSRMLRPSLQGNPGLRHLLQQQTPPFRQQLLTVQQLGGPRAQLSQQQMQNAGGQQGQQQFDDVPSFDIFQ